MAAFGGALELTAATAETSGDALAVPLSYLLARPIAAVLGETIFKVSLDFAYNYTAVGVWLVAVICIAFLASIIPAHAAGRISVRESLAYG